MAETTYLEKPMVHDPSAISSKEPSSIDPLPKDELETPSPEAEDESGYPHGAILLSIIIALCLAVFLVALDQTIVATAIPRISDDFKSISDIGWYGSAYFLTTTALQPTFGKIYTIFSIKWTFLSAIALFELGSLVCGVAPNSIALIIGRAIAGLGAGGIFSGGVVILAYCLPLRKRPIAFGLFGGMFGIASVAGPLLGGVFTDKVTWKLCFLINLPIGAITVIVIIFILKIAREDNPEGLSFGKRVQNLDLIGASIIIPTVICLLLALQWGGSTYPWNNSRIIGLFVGFVLLTSIFVYSQIRLGDKATLPPRLFRNRSVLAAVAFSFFFGAGFFALIYYLPLYFQSVKGSSATQSGIELLPLLLATVISSIVTGALITVIGYYTPILILCMALFAIGSGLITTYAVDTPFGNWFGYQVLAGAGIGCGFQGGIITVQTVLPLEDVPVATAVISFFQSLGGALFIAVSQTVFQNGLVSAIRVQVPQLPPDALLHAGATQIRNVLARAGLSDKLPEALIAYVKGLTNTYYISVACACVAFLAACCLEWKSVKNGPAKKELALAV